MTEGLNVFSSAAATDRILTMISADAQGTTGPRERAASTTTVTAPRRRRLAFGRGRTA
jgi:hypothetical protein